MKKRLNKIIIGILLVTIIIFIALAALILNPQILFAQNVTYRDFTIYSKDTIPKNYKTIIDYAIELIKTSEIYEPNQKLNIFLCDETMYNEIDTKLLGPAMSRCVNDNILLKVQADFDKNVLVGWNSKRNLKKTIAHEAIHFYQMKKIGMLKFNPLIHPPTWKTEGYPEYIANQEDLKTKEYDLKNSIKKVEEYEKAGDHWVETEPGQLDPLVYYKGRVMIEYLIDVRHLAYTEILNKNLLENEVMDEMKSWCNTQKKAKLFLQPGFSCFFDYLFNVWGLKKTS
jgi:hypothetical protein